MTLERKKKETLEQIEQLQNQLGILDQMIHSIKADETPEPSKQRVTKTYIKAEAWMDTIKRMLADDALGKKTKDLHHTIQVVTNEDLNYNTFRSYLNRLKKRNEIHQDDRRNWHLKD